MPFFFRFIVIVLLTGISIETRAETAPLPPELKAFLSRPDQQKAIAGLMNRHWQSFLPECTTPELKQTNVIITQPPSFGPNGAPTAGMWRVVGHVEGCEKSSVFTVMYAFGPDGRMARFGLLPGTTIADYRLQRDAIAYATMAMSKIAPEGCKDIHYIDTKFIDFGEVSPATIPNKERRSWTEEWTVRACGVTGLVTMHFIPDTTGTSITTSPDQTRQITP